MDTLRKQNDPFPTKAADPMAALSRSRRVKENAFEHFWDVFSGSRNSCRFTQRLRRHCECPNRSCIDLFHRKRIANSKRCEAEPGCVDRRSSDATVRIKGTSYKSEQRSVSCSHCQRPRTVCPRAHHRRYAGGRARSRLFWACAGDGSARIGHESGGCVGFWP
jgi:hypothetical protein